MTKDNTSVAVTRSSLLNLLIREEKLQILFEHPSLQLFPFTMLLMILKQSTRMNLMTNMMIKYFMKVKKNATLDLNLKEFSPSKSSDSLKIVVGVLSRPSSSVLIFSEQQGQI